jgi:hypothetical protein
LGSKIIYFGSRYLVFFVQLFSQIEQLNWATGFIFQQLNPNPEGQQLFEH